MRRCLDTVPMASEILLDSSVVVGLLEDEEATRGLEDLLLTSDVAISAPNLVEVKIVMAKRGGLEFVSPFLTTYGVAVLPFDEAEAEIAEEAHVRYGKGVHPAKLNYGDCMAYAASRTSGRALLFVGDDFTLTDVARA